MAICLYIVMIMKIIANSSKTDVGEPKFAKNGQKSHSEDYLASELLPLVALG